MLLFPSPHEGQAFNFLVSHQEIGLGQVSQGTQDRREQRALAPAESKRRKGVQLSEASVRETVIPEIFSC